MSEYKSGLQTPSRDSDDVEIARRIAEKVAEAGGRAYYVGGYVRDGLLGRETGDIDIEVHGIAPERLLSILSEFGTPTSFGKSFGIYGVAGRNIDIALPRREKKQGSGHRDFDVAVDPYIGTYKAASRRDFTINALMRDVLTGEITDCFGGMDDLKNKVIRHVNPEAFAEDPLRVLRAARFSAQLGFRVAPETADICRTVDISALSRERVSEELKKALLTSGKPSAFFDVMREAKGLSYWFSELEALIGIEQNPAYHPEGDVYTHTMLVLDSAAGRRKEAKNCFGFMLAALTHDFGKAVATVAVNGVIHAYDHEKAGMPLVDAFLRRLTDEKELISYVENMVLLHMKPNVTARNGSSVKATNRMFDESVDPRALMLLAACDNEGKKRPEENTAAQRFLRERLKIYEDIKASPAVSGADLINAGMKPGRAFSDALTYAAKLHLAGIPKDRALKETLAYAKRLSSE